MLSQKEDKLRNDDDRKENLLYQMQRIFAYLQESEKKYYNASGNQSIIHVAIMLTLMDGCMDGTTV
jgi:hypothetical protein